MPGSQPASPPPPPEREAPGASGAWGLSLPAVVVLGAMLPGLGHLALGQRRRAAAFLAIVSTTFAVGLALKGQLYQLDPTRPLSMLGWLTVSATGLLGLAARLAGLAAGDPEAPTFEYGTTYLLTAGLMNILLLIDLRDLVRAARTWLPRTPAADGNAER